MRTIEEQEEELGRRIAESIQIIATLQALHMQEADLPTLLVHSTPSGLPDYGILFDQPMLSREVRQYYPSYSTAYIHQNRVSPMQQAYQHLGALFFLEGSVNSPPTCNGLSIPGFAVPSNLDGLGPTYHIHFFVSRFIARQIIKSLAQRSIQSRHRKVL